MQCRVKLQSTYFRMGNTELLILQKRCHTNNTTEKLLCLCDNANITGHTLPRKPNTKRLQRMHECTENTVQTLPRRLYHAVVTAKALQCRHYREDLHLKHYGAANFTLGFYHTWTIYLAVKSCIVKPEDINARTSFFMLVKVCVVVSDVMSAWKHIIGIDLNMRCKI